MTDFFSLLSKSNENIADRATKEQKHGLLLSKAFPLSPDQIILPGDKSSHTDKANKAADYVMGKTDKKPAFKFKPIVKLPPQSIGELLIHAKEIDKKKQNVLHGTGITKRVAEQAEKQFDIDSRELFSILRKNSYFIKLGNRNLPIPELIEKGYFNNKINDFRNGKISVHYIQTYVTANGMSFLAELIKKQNEKK